MDDMSKSERLFSATETRFKRLDVLTTQLHHRFGGRKNSLPQQRHAPPSFRLVGLQVGVQSATWR